jgi:hypothetical protein
MRRLLLTVLCAALVASQAHADRAAARALWKHGTDEFLHERWDGAIAAFESAFREEPSPVFVFNLAQAQRRAGRSADAVRSFQRFIDLSKSDPKFVAEREEASQSIRELEQVSAKTSLPAAALAPTVEAPQHSRWPVWFGVGVGGAVVAGGVVAIAIVATTPKDAMVPATSAGNLQATFP